MNAISYKKHLILFLLALTVLISRLPFLDAGYGVEEDSWGIAVAAYHTHLYGEMEASRLPGHPVNEFIYSVFWGYGAFIFNFFSALCSAVCFVFFYLTAQKLQIKNYILASLALVFTPVVYINSTCTIDYLWALMFALISFYFLIENRLMVSAIFLGLAVGCRINTAVLFLPFLYWIYAENKHKISWNKFIKFSSIFALVCILCFLPVMKVYGWNFFSYSDQFPYPNWPKIIYKSTIGVIGLPAVLVLVVLFILKFKNDGFKRHSEPIHAFFLMLLAIQMASFLMLPQKSAYLMLLVPFGILWLGHYFSVAYLNALCVALLFSSFFMSVNLTDSLRGSNYSDMALKTTIAGQEIFFDLFSGPIQSDNSKRKNKLKYTASVLKKAEKINYPSIVICGWWFNQILIEQMENKYNGSLKFAFYLNPTIMEQYVLKGYQIYYLSEQDVYNDLFYGFNRTKNIAKPF